MLVRRIRNRETGEVTEVCVAGCGKVSLLRDCHGEGTLVDEIWFQRLLPKALSDFRACLLFDLSRRPNDTTKAAEPSR